MRSTCWPRVRTTSETSWPRWSTRWLCGLAPRGSSSMTCTTSLPPISGGSSRFVERLPATTHVVFGTRVDPVLPIQRWRARGQLAEIRDADLRLEEEHVNSFMHQYGVDLSRGDVHTLATRTEGWMAGVQLAALSLLHDSDDPSSFIRRLDGTEHVVADFLIEEVLDQQSAEMAQFLYATSVVDEFDVELANCSPR